MERVTRRHVIATLSATTVTLCPALLNAAVEFDWGEDVPTNAPRGQAQTVELAAGAAEVDVSALAPGEVAVLARPTTDAEYTNTDMVQYIAVLRLTEAQRAAGGARGQSDDRYFVANLVCPHRGYAIGMTGREDAPFACTKRGARHGSVFAASGEGVGGKSVGDFLSVPAHSWAIDGDSAVLSLS